jgi:hypothetical protein
VLALAPGYSLGVSGRPTRQFPPAPWRQRGRVTIVPALARLADAQARVGPAARVVPVAPGRTLAGALLASYEAGSTLRYRELLVASALVYRAPTIGLWADHVWVDSASSLEGPPDLGATEAAGLVLAAPERRCGGASRRRRAAHSGQRGTARARPRALACAVLRDPRPGGSAGASYGASDCSTPRACASRSAIEVCWPHSSSSGPPLRSPAACLSACPGPPGGPPRAPLSPPPAALPRRPARGFAGAATRGRRGRAQPVACCRPSEQRFRQRTCSRGGRSARARSTLRLLVALEPVASIALAPLHEEAIVCPRGRVPLSARAKALPLLAGAGLPAGRSAARSAWGPTATPGLPRNTSYRRPVAK